jgi:hypothetical protein
VAQMSQMSWDSLSGCNSVTEIRDGVNVLGLLGHRDKEATKSQIGP